ncbi:cytochrome c biogenesis protein [Halopolyspora algeriensis]|uniref:Cytochrome c biogenesis protein n=1 Tax=Halopolyspora algeriensis TaxID=1500506 RepID=A0A368VXF4_9ACTN|nr:cytochrome c biogenesis protein ResB [Halopolyspora algeriensis]RCW46888.1 cytochrome c biogenesis protein [Halopolyspora algeriensis]TQM47979.1 cytochrome c biogenesis protein [Halopolyspora algeriensis]
MRISSITAALAFLRNTWRGLTSMRTALVLLFLLALAALPGALLPQRPLNPANVEKFYDEHPTLAPILDAVDAFNVFGSVWFAAIYVLLFVSLVGCLVPRCLEYLRQLRARPVRTPRNLGRMPHHEQATVDSSVDEVMSATRRRLRGWRTSEHTEADGARSISAERGYAREAGNLVFHFALLGLLIAVAGGELYKYEGQVIVMADGSSFCNSGTYNYDSFRAGLTVDGTELSPFCVRVDDFDVKYLHSGQPSEFRADISYQSGESLETGVWKQHDLEVNNPLRTAGDRVYLTGHGYAPRFTVTFPGGETRTQTVQWQPMNTTTMLSQGATKFDPPGMPDEQRRQQNQIAITGLFAPTAAMDGKVLSSGFPALRDPAVAVDVLKGQLGVSTGRGQSIFSVDQSMVESGKLERVARENLRVGEEIRLDDGTVVRFDGVQRWVNLQVSHNPFQPYVLGCAIAIVVGLGASLSIKRRRVWVRAAPTGPSGSDPTGGAAASPRTLVEVGGLARTDQAGYGEEFTRLSGELLDSVGGSPGSAENHEAVSARGRNS